MADLLSLSTFWQLYTHYPDFCVFSLRYREHLGSPGRRSNNYLCWTWMGQLNCWKTVIVRNSKSCQGNPVTNFFAPFFFWRLALGYVGLSKPIFDGFFIHYVGDIELIWNLLENCSKIPYFPHLLLDAIKVQCWSTNVASGIISIKHHWMAITNDIDHLNNELGLETTID